LLTNYLLFTGPRFYLHVKIDNVRDHQYVGLQKKLQFRQLPHELR
ncbi:unnamed protein product, partial [Allacma fusca]